MRNLVPHLVRHRRPIVLLIHAGLVAAAYLLAFLLRFDFTVPLRLLTIFWHTLPILLAVRLIGFWVFSLDKGLWRYVSVGDILTIVKSTTATSLIFIALAVGIVGRSFPRSIYLLDWMLTIAFVAGVRLTVRALREYHPRLRAGASKRVVVVGAGDAAEQLLRELDTSLTSAYDIVALVDDDPAMHHRRIRGVEVAGSVSDLPAVCVRGGAKEIVIAIPSATKEEVRRIVAICQQTGLNFRRIPPLSDLLSSPSRIAQLQDVRPEDLLDREVIRVDMHAVARELAGKRILITGGAGSIGSELARQVAALGVQRLILLDHNENGLHLLHVELSERFRDLALIPAVGDALNPGRMRELLDIHHPNVIYHAAAFKHVPLMEENVLEAIENNVLGTELVIREAARVGVGRFVLISTDKAVAPVSIMGMTKRLAERIAMCRNDEGCTFVAVRFGNVLGSDGSVLPLFKWQVSTWGRLALTDLNASRYFMLPSEAVQLVLEAGRIGENGDIFFLQMGEPVRIADLAERFLTKSGLEAGLDVEIAVTGLRPGERLTEFLVADRERLLPTSHERILRIRDGGLDPARFAADLEQLRRFVQIRDRPRAAEKLKEMAAEY